MHHVDIDEPLNVEYIFDDMEKETNSDVLSNSFTFKPTVSNTFLDDLMIDKTLVTCGLSDRDPIFHAFFPILLTVLVSI